PDHKLFADSLRITLVDDQEFGTYDRAVVYPAGSKDESDTYQASRRRFADLATRFALLSPLLRYVQGQAWNEPDHATLLRRTIGAGMETRGELDPARPEHLGLALEATSVFALGLASCVGGVFHQHLLP